jgi:multiple antibiotic resistance protein
MPNLLGFAVLTFTSLLVMVDPLAAVPIFLASTAGDDPPRRAATLRRAVVTAFLVMTTFALLGDWILRLFSITPEAFRIAGGIILFGIGFDMLQVRRSRTRTTEEEENEGYQREDPGIIPLGMPLLAGPGTITTVIALISRARSVTEQGMIFLSIVLVVGITWALLTMAPRVAGVLGRTGTNVLQRLMGLIGMVVGVQFVIDGARAVLLEILSQVPR